ncbi:hypothetical protein BP5796_05568 [Coleophoma crateriformis]|uniref:Sister chromatid cohesion protein DCC1 n=1 Tax=Coleophoma crateriformis TaxID=565419 RepID=A0A3D8S3X4_9HELO|nr:hypothetical protein BP5796_05568 [Coleophoma crateriformis]
MAQAAPAIPFSATLSQQAFKLLELPPELLSVLESENPPTLHIRSETPASHALLHCGEQKYQIRQKNTSNPILILAPSSSTAPVHTQLEIPEADKEEEGEGEGEGDIAPPGVPIPSIATIAKCEDTLELVPWVDEGGKEGVGKGKEKKVNKWHEKFAKTRSGGGVGGKK